MPEEMNVTEGQDLSVEAAKTVNVTNTFTSAENDDSVRFIENLPTLIKETKAGYKSTEFWLAIATAGLIQVDAIPLPEKYEGWVAGALAVAYALSRGFAKQGVPHVEEAKKGE